MTDLSKLKNTIVPVVVIKNTLTETAAKKLCEAVLAGGSQCLEITLRTPEGLAAIKTLKKVCPDFIVGAGTVLTVEQVNECATAGVDFLVSPGLSPETVTAAKSSGLTIIPGVITPTEMQQAMSLGLALVKFFPAEQAGGASMLKAFGSVYPDVAIMPTGGIKQSNLSEYTKLSNVFAVGGSWVCTSEAIISEDYKKISELLTLANKEFVSS